MLKYAPTNTQEGKKQKLTWLLVLQGWAMLWVVIGHSPLKLESAKTTPLEESVHWLDALGENIAENLTFFAYSFHMPLFIIISGYLFYMTRIAKNWQFIPMIKEKWVRLGIPYIFFIIIGIIIKFVYSDGRPLDTSLLGMIRNFTRPFDGALREMWFVSVIIVYFLLYPLYKWILKSKLATIIVFIVGCVFYFIPIKQITDFFALNHAVHFFVFFFMGVAVCKWRLDNWITTYVAVLFNMAIFTLCLWQGIPLLKQISGCLFFWGLAVIVDRKLTVNLFHSFRDYTYQIFLISIFGQIAVKLLYKRFAFSGSYLLWWAICIIVGLYIPVIVSKIMQKYSGPGASKARRLIGL